FRRRRLGVLAGLVLVIALIAWLASGTGGSSKHAATRSKPAATGARQPTAALPAVEAGLLPWKLAAPLSRMVVLPGGGAQLAVAGGLLDSQATSAKISFLDTGNGTRANGGAMASGVHDAAGAVIGGQGVVFGGGSPSTVAGVQTLPGFTPGGTAGPSTGQATGALPQPRSDHVAVTVAQATYVLGGYDGTKPDPEVLATTDGKRFTSVATLSVPVRYPAAAGAGGQIYVFGGQAVGGTTGANQPVDAIQRVDPATHKATVVGHLPIPLQAAVAWSAGGLIYVAGGDSASAPTTVAGVGTTQLGGWGTGTGQGAGVAGAGVATSNAIWAFDPTTGRLLDAGRLQVPVSHAGVAVVAGRAWIVGGESGGKVMATVQVVSPNLSFGSAGSPGAGSPYFGNQLLIADRGNNRLLLMDSAMKLTWTYPSATSPPDPLGFYFPDDAFFINHGTAIISNQEQNNTIVEVAYPSGNIVWSYGHPKVSGTGAGYLHEPDDAYLLRDGRVSVADANNCRVLVINNNGTVASQIGTNGVCRHNPPASMGTPNGDTPLWNGNLLVSEITGSWVSEYTPAGQLVWTVHLPIAYPSDPQQLGASLTSNPDRYLIADYARPGQVLQFTRAGQILQSYKASAGPGMLDHPSLAEELPNGIYLINDDYNHRMVAIDPATGALVWQYGITAHRGTGPGMLDTPDGFDILAPGGATPTHPQTG
ncbi:MAG: hypothetical protein ACR2NJ_09845, partial [Acidimicrobiales bacterium]